MLYFDAGLNDLINCNMIFRAIDAQSLIGTVGGYIGLFLGYSLLEMPKTILVILNKLKKRYWISISGTNNVTNSKIIDQSMA